MYKLFITLSFFFLLAGCSKKKEDLTYSNNTEPDTTWINKKFFEEFPNAHSGQFVSVTDSIQNFSLGFHKTLNEISSKTLKRVNISAWIYLPDSTSEALSGLSLVCSIDDKSKNIFWADFPVGDKIKEAKKWIFVKGELPFNAKLEPHYAFTGYVLNTSKKRVLVDDIEFSFSNK